MKTVFNRRYSKNIDKSIIIPIKKRMNMGMLEILSREQERRTREVYLYEGEEGRWYAYEHSAELLGDFLNGIVTIRQFIHDTFLILSIVEIDISLLDKCNITSCSDTEMVIACPRNLN